MFARIPRIAFVLLFFLTLFALTFAVNVVAARLPSLSAAPLVQEALPPEVDEYLAAAGVGIIILLGVEILKQWGKIPDGAAGKVTVVASVVAYAGLVIAGVFGFNIQGEAAQMIVGLLTTALKLLLTIATAVGGFKTLRAAQVLNPLASRRRKMELPEVGHFG